VGQWIKNYKRFKGRGRKGEISNDKKEEGDAMNIS
jgi:hypothetical protein